MNCALTWTTNDETNLTKLDQTEAKLHLLGSEIDMLQEMIHDISFQPNPNCGVCLQNKDYLLRLQREKKRNKKRSELDEVSKYHQKLQHFFRKRFTTTGDVHFVDCLSNMTVSNIRQALIKKKDCVECGLWSQRLTTSFDRVRGRAWRLENQLGNECAHGSSSLHGQTPGMPMQALSY